MSPHGCAAWKPGTGNGALFGVFFRSQKHQKVPAHSLRLTAHGQRQRPQHRRSSVALLKLPEAAAATRWRWRGRGGGAETDAKYIAALLDELIV